jgi:hypothetical protein
VPTSSWQAAIDGRRHDVVARVGYWNARRTVDVDGRHVLDLRPRWFEVPTYWQSSTEHPFAIDGHPAALRVVPGRWNYQLDIVVDGTSLGTGLPAGDLPPAKLTGRSRADEALHAPIIPESRRSWALRATALYPVLVGVTMFCVAPGRESFVGKTISEGALLGIILVGLGGAIVSLVGAPDRRTPAWLAAGLWLGGAVLSIPLLMPPVERIRVLTWLSGFIGRDSATLFQAAGFLPLVGLAVNGLVSAFTRLRSMSDRRIRPVLARILAIASIAAVSTAILELADGSALRWLDPISTIAAHLLVTVGLTCAVVFAATVRYLPTSSPAVAAEGQDGGPRWLTATLMTGALALAWAAAAPLIGPIDAPRLRIQPASAGSALDAARVRRIFDDARARSGLSGDGLAFAVLFEPRGQQQFGSTRQREGAEIIIRIDSESAAARQRNLLAYHVAGALVDAVAYRGSHLSAGYAYWAAHNALNPFVTADAPGDRRAVCREIPSLDLTAVSDGTFVPLSLPFVLAEREDGPRGAQDLMRKIATSPPAAAAWKQQVLDACGALLERAPGP